MKNLVSTQYFLYTTVNNLEHIFSFEFRLQIIFSFESRVEVFRFSDTLYAEVNTTEGKRLSFQPLYRHHKFLGVITIIMSIPPLWLCVCVCVWRRQWHPTPVLLPGKSHGWRNPVGCIPWGRQESDTTERLHFHFPLSCIGEGNGNPLQCSCLENSRDGGAL